jgi:hypothetical protein
VGGIECRFGSIGSDYDLHRSSPWFTARLLARVTLTRPAPNVLIGTARGWRWRPCGGEVVDLMEREMGLRRLSGMPNPGIVVTRRHQQDPRGGGPRPRSLLPRLLQLRRHGRCAALGCRDHHARLRRPADRSHRGRLVHRQLRRDVRRRLHGGGRGGFPAEPPAVRRQAPAAHTR